MYLLISAPFLIVAVIVWVFAAQHRGRHPARPWRTTALTMAAILVLTAIFDNLMIASGLVGYSDTQRLGLHLGLVPVEDFFYSVVVVLIVTALWDGSHGKQEVQ